MKTNLRLFRNTGKSLAYGSGPLTWDLSKQTPDWHGWPIPKSRSCGICGLTGLYRPGAADPYLKTNFADYSLLNKNWRLTVFDTTVFDSGHSKMRAFLRFLEEEDGATAVEYAVMLALIVGAIIASVTLSGSVVSNSWDDTATNLQNAYNP